MKSLPPSIVEALARCDRELAEIDTRADIDTSPAYLSTMGRADWEHEKRLLLEAERSRGAE